MASREGFPKSCEEVKILIKANTVDGRLFRLAAVEGNLNMVKSFLKAKDLSDPSYVEKKKFTNADAADENGMTPLHLAASHGHTAVVKCLISSNAEVDVQNKNRESPLYMASREGHERIANILLAHGADPFLCSFNKEETAIDIAAARGHCALVVRMLNSVFWYSKKLNIYKLVRDTGIDPNIVSKTGETMLHEAWDVEVAHFLLKFNVLVNARDSSGNTPLHRACSIDIAKILIDYGAQVEARNKAKISPLYVAVDEENFEMTKTLLENNADVNVRCGLYDRTPLQVAIRHTTGCVIPLLLEWGADVNVKDKNGSTTLHEAAKLGRVNSLQLLIKAGVDVNAVDLEGNTPLHFASCKAIVDLLLQNGADTNICHKDGLSTVE